MGKKIKFLLIVAFCTMLPTCKTFAYTSLVSLGDSLSDNGNVARFSNGAIWVESLADDLGADLYDFAYGGATTWYDNPAIGSTITGLQWQVETVTPFLGTLSLDSTLLTVWAGANDFIQARDVTSAVTNIETALTNLYSVGVRDFLVLNLPDIGKTPEFVALGASAAAIASAWTVNFNHELATMLLDFVDAHADSNLMTADVYHCFSEYTVGSSDWEDLFWVDGFHPSAEGHDLIFTEARNAIAPVPEPGTLLLFGYGFVCLCGARIVRRKNF